MSNIFNFYEIVKIISNDETYPEIIGKKGVILGMSQNDDNTWGYAIFIDDITWSVDEKNLKSTGKFSSRDQFYNNENRVKIIVDEHGEGKIKEE